MRPLFVFLLLYFYHSVLQGSLLAGIFFLRDKLTSARWDFAAGRYTAQKKADNFCTAYPLY